MKQRPKQIVESESKSDDFSRSDMETPKGVTLTELQSENESLKATIKLNAVRKQVTEELTKAGARTPELLFESIEDGLQFSDDGELQNAAALVADLKSRFPEQFGRDLPPVSIDGGAGAALRPQLTKAALAKMKPTEIAELDWADVRRVLAG